MDKEENDLKTYQDDALILIVDDDVDFCKSLQKTIFHWGVKVKSTTNPLHVMDLVRNSFYNVILLDVVMPRKSGMELIPEIAELSPDSKVIVMTVFADKKMDIQALSMGAFYFLEKPLDSKLLLYTIRRALEVQEAELEYKKIFEELKHDRNELLEQRSRLEHANGQLIETSNALSILARNIEMARDDAEIQIVHKVRVSIVPIIEKLQQDRKLGDYRPDLELLMNLVDDLPSGIGAASETVSTLTSTELRIVSLIKNGLTTDEIAKHMHISPLTVKAHRRNIRKKLKLDNSNHSLRTYLQSNLGDEMAE
ncbi:MAG: response regulator [Deltaproteobacteria bacterium]|nr:response regulator [Deltaproteobacteria bacterium]